MRPRSSCFSDPPPVCLARPIIVNLSNELCRISKGCDFDPVLKKLRQPWPPAYQLEGTHSGGLESPCIHPPDFSWVKIIDNDFRSPKCLCLFSIQDILVSEHTLDTANI